MGEEIVIYTYILYYNAQRKKAGEALKRHA